MKFYRARTRIGAPGNPKAEAGEQLPLSIEDAAELIAIDAIDPDPVWPSEPVPQPIVSEALIAPVVRPADADIKTPAPAKPAPAKPAAKPRAPRKAKAS